MLGMSGIIKGRRSNILICPNNMMPKAQRSSEKPKNHMYVILEKICHASHGVTFNLI